MLNTRSIVHVVAPLVAALALGCSGKDVVAEVGGTKIHKAEVDAQRRGRDDAAKALDAMIPRAMLAEAARRARLDEDVRVRARLAQAEREILAQAFLDRSLEEATREDTLRRRYLEGKEALAKRRIHVQHIAARASRADPASRAAAQSKISTAAARLAGGEPFEVVARALSDDVISGQRGGDLGPLLEGQVDPAFFEAAAALKKGETSRPFETGFGWHIARALEDPGTVVPEYEEAKGQLAGAARREAEAKLLERLRAEIAVKIHHDRLPAPAAPGAGEGT